MRQAAKEREDREETRFARDRFSLPTGGDRSRAQMAGKNLERRVGRRAGREKGVGRGGDCQLRS